MKIFDIFKSSPPPCQFCGQRPEYKTSMSNIARFIFFDDGTGLADGNRTVYEEYADPKYYSKTNPLVFPELELSEFVNQDDLVLYMEAKSRVRRHKCVIYSSSRRCAACNRNAEELLHIEDDVEVFSGIDAVAAYAYKRDFCLQPDFLKQFRDFSDTNITEIDALDEEARSLAGELMLAPRQHYLAPLLYWITIMSGDEGDLTDVEISERLRSEKRKKSGWSLARRD